MLNRVAADRAFGGCHLDAGLQFLAVKGFAPAITFSDQQIGRHMFIGRKSLVTFFTLAAATNCIAGIAGVNHFVLIVATMGAFHGRYLYLSLYPKFVY